MRGSESKDDDVRADIDELWPCGDGNPPVGERCGAKGEVIRIWRDVAAKGWMQNREAVD